MLPPWVWGGPSLCPADSAGPAACIGGMVSVSKGEVTLVPTTFEWADKIDVARAEAAREKAEKVLHDKNASDTDLRLAEAKLHRALVRKSVASNL